MDYSLPGSPVQGILQAKNTGVGSNPFFRGLSWLRDLIRGLLHPGRLFTVWATREPKE